MTRRLPPVALGLALALAALPAFAYQPTDPDFEKQWGLHNTGQEVEYRRGTPGADVDAVRAWDLSRGAGVVIAVADTGVRHDDADLAATMWKSPGLTIDGKTCRKGTHGYDFHEGDCDPRGTHSHGTNVAMPAAGAGNNGVAGIGLAFDARVMALRVGTLPALSATTKSNLARAVRWAIEARQQDVNVRVLNISFGGDAYGGVLHAAIRDAGDAGILVVASSGNDSDRNNDEQPHYPCAYDVPTLICVGGSDQDDNLIGSWGPTTVDLVGPASNVYGCGTGTSCSTPLVSAAAALVWSRQPGLTPEQVKAKILHNVDPLPDPDDRAKVLTGGRLNAYRALTGPIPRGPDPPSTTTTTRPRSSPPPTGDDGGNSGGSSGGGSDAGADGGGGESSGNDDSQGTGAPGGGGTDSSAAPRGTSAGGSPGTDGSAPRSTGAAGQTGDDPGSLADDDRAALPVSAPPGGRAEARYTDDDGGGRGGWWLVGGGTAALAGAALLTRRRWLPLLPFG